MAIERIPQLSVNSLVSSSSIFSTAAVVKELIDNSIDAKANDIKVELDGETGGLKYCAVKDNGIGVPEFDRDLMCCNCTTSKLTTEMANKNHGLLSDLSTLGFRGEALFFISQLIQLDSKDHSMTITSRTSDEKMGQQWNISRLGNTKGSKSVVAAQVGTSIKLVGLFSSFVVRQKILAKQSSKLIEEIRYLLIGYSLTYPNVRFSLKVVTVGSSGKISQNSAHMKRNLSLNVSLNRASLISQICKVRNLKRSFYEGDISNDDDFNCPIKFNAHYTLPIMTGNTEVSTVRLSQMFLSVNGRPIDKVRSPLFKGISNIFREIYTSLNLLKPAVWNLNVELTDSKDVDVNIEPLKNDVMIFKQSHFLESLKTIFVKIVQETHGVVVADVDNDSDDSPAKDININESRYTTSNQRHLKDITNQSSSTQRNIFEGKRTNAPDKEDEMPSTINDTTENESLFLPDDTAITSFNDEEKDWHFNLQHNFSQDVEGSFIVESNDEDTFVNEDLTLSRDINLSNPFIYSKIVRSAKTMGGESSATSIPNSTVPPIDPLIIKPTVVVSKTAKEILTGNPKRKHQSEITKFIMKRPKKDVLSRSLHNLTESTSNLTIFVKGFKTVHEVNDFDEKYMNSGEISIHLNEALLSWYREMGVRLIGKNGDLIIEEWHGSAGGISRLEFR